MNDRLVVVSETLIEHSDINPLRHQLGVVREPLDVLPRQIKCSVEHGELLVRHDEIVHRKGNEIGSPAFAVEDRLILSRCGIPLLLAVV